MKPRKHSWDSDISTSSGSGADVPEVTLAAKPGFPLKGLMVYHSMINYIYSILQNNMVYHNILWYIIIYCGILYYIMVYYSTLLSSQLVGMRIKPVGRNM